MMAHPEYLVLLLPVVIAMIGLAVGMFIFGRD